ncbi:MAG: hypothetical protein ACR2PS_05535 [Pseudomonadales bacterium]
MIRIWQNCWPLIIALSGCASNPVELPSWEPLSYVEDEVQGPLSLPERPQIATSDEAFVTFHVEQFAVLVDYMDVAEANQSIAEDNAEALKAMGRAYNHLIDAGKMQREVAILRQQLLDEERKAHFLDNLWHRGVIVLGLIVVAL